MLFRQVIPERYGGIPSYPNFLSKNADMTVVPIPTIETKCLCSLNKHTPASALRLQDLRDAGRHLFFSGFKESSIERICLRERAFRCQELRRAWRLTVRSGRHSPSPLTQGTGIHGSLSCRKRSRHLRDPSVSVPRSKEPAA